MDEPYRAGQPPHIAWRPDPAEPRSIWAHSQSGQDYTLHWGDGTYQRLPVWSQPVKHTYPAPGAYTITIATGEGEQVLAQVVIRSTATPQITGQHGSDNPAFYDLTITEAEPDLLSWYRLDWGDGTDPIEVAGPPGRLASHGYADGTYTLTARDLGTRRTWHREITVATPQQDPQVKFSAPAPSSDPRRVRATLTARDRAVAVRLDWGDGTTTRPELAQVGTTAEHTYAADGTYITQVWYSDGVGDGAAWDITVPLTRGTRPTSQIVIVADPLNDRAIWAKYAGSVTDYTLYWGDGTEERRSARQPPARHVYDDYGTYLVRGVNDYGVERSERVTLTPPDPPPPGPVPVVALHRLHGTYDMLWMRLLFAPDQGDGYDHRTPAHTVDWDDGTVDEVPAGAAHADHQYAGRVWPHGQRFPQVRVTDRATGKTTTVAASELRTPQIDFDKMSNHPPYTPPEWESWSANLPTKGPATSYTVYNSGRLIRSQAPQYDNATYFYFRATYPDGWSSSTLVGPDGTPLDSGVLLSDSTEVHNNVCAYDWDWRGDPRLIRVTPFHHGTGSWWEFEVDWGDETATEEITVTDPAPDERTGKASEPILGGSNPRASHWYTTHGPVELRTRARKRDGGTWHDWTSCVVGECRIATPVVSGHSATIAFTLQDSYHPVRVDWGDSTPITRQHPAGTAGGRHGSLTHTYATSGVYAVTVYAPMQDPRTFTVQIGSKEKKHMAFKAVYTPVSQWWGGYSGTYRITNQGKDPATWELSFLLDVPAEVKDVWGGGQLKRQENKQHKPGKAKSSTEPPLALYKRAGPTGRGSAYVIKCTKPVGAGESVDVGFRVEAPGQEQAPEPRQCSINGGSCSGRPTPPPDEDTEPPTVPTDVKVTNAGPRSVSLSWTESTDDTGVRQYDVALDGDIHSHVPAPASSTTLTGLTPETEYEVKLRAVDLAGNRSLWSHPVTATTTKDTPSDNKPWLATVAPFVDMGLWPTPSLGQFAEESGLKAFNLGFVTSISASECRAVWAGQGAYSVAEQWQADNITNFRSTGHYPVISFGGETGVELAQAATNVDELHEQYKLVITTYGLDVGAQHIDFDIEGSAQLDHAANARRAAAVSRLQKEFPELRVSWTLPVLPEGLTNDGLGVLRAAYNAGVRIDLVNIMTMYFYRNEDMGQLVQQAAESLHSQLAEFFPGMTSKARWSKVSVCPMIGQCGDGSIYSLAHAEQTTKFAAQKKFGQLTYWEAGRDRNACLSEALYQCTNVPQDPWDYAFRFGAYQQ